MSMHMWMRIYHYTHNKNGFECPVECGDEPTDLLSCLRRTTNSRWALRSDIASRSQPWKWGILWGMQTVYKLTLNAAESIRFTSHSEFSWDYKYIYFSLTVSGLYHAYRNGEVVIFRLGKKCYPFFYFSDFAARTATSTCCHWCWVSLSRFKTSESVSVLHQDRRNSSLAACWTDTAHHLPALLQGGGQR